MRKALGLITLLLSLFSCGNRTKQESSTIVVEKNVEETYKQHDTDKIEVVKDRMNNTETQSTHVHLPRLTLKKVAIMTICEASTLHLRMTWMITA